MNFLMIFVYLKFSAQMCGTVCACVSAALGVGFYSQNESWKKECRLKALPINGRYCFENGKKEKQASKKEITRFHT